MTTQTNDTDTPINVAPTLTLSRRGLVIGFVVMAAAGLSVYAMFPDSIGGPDLPVAVRLENEAVETTNGRGAVVTEVVVIKNLADHPIGRLSIEINGQYLLFQDRPLQPGETLVLPQGVFTDKRSSHRFDPSKHEVDDVMVTGQLPSGSRGVTKFDFK